MDINKLLEQTLEKKASDFHLLADMPAFVRIDGQLLPLTEEVFSHQDIETAVKKIISENEWKKFNTEKDLDFAYSLSNQSRFRVNIAWERGKIALTARSIPSDIPSMEDADMPEIAYKLCNMDRGLILVTGPTGCGKSTSLAAMVEYINQTRNTNIITLEDPIEFIFKPQKSIIRQRQLGSDMLSFQNGLTHALRQDPNVIMVGEMRNLETIATTITLAETGHLVFATLHTYSAAQTIDRIIDIFPPHQQNQIRSQISITLKAIISQKLIPKQGGGRIAAREILINTPAIANLIRENKVAQIKSSIQTSAKEGMITLDNSLLEIYKKGLISKEVLDENLTNKLEDK